MSNALAIAATTATLRDLLQTGMTALDVDDALGSNVLVSVDAPDVALRDSEVAGADSRLNVFLYNVARNSGYSGNLPAARDARGERTGNPVLGLDLYYLLTAYGVDDYQSEMLLGGAIQVLHDTPALGRDAIRDALDPATHPGLPAQLQAAGLADQFEYLKVTPVPMPSDEISRLWPAFNSPYRPSAAYVVSVVLIESTRSTRSTLPVAQRIIRAVPFRDLRIDRVVSLAGAHVPIDGTSTLRILGRNIGANDISVWINNIDVTAAVDPLTRSAGEIRVALAAAPAGLHPGIAGVQLVQPIMLGEPEAPHEGFASNVATFVLAPTITPTVAAGSIDVTCTPPIAAGQRVRLLLNQSDAAPGAVPRAYSFSAPAGNGVVPPAIETGLVNIPISGVTPGAYVVRLQVDGAQSALGMVAGRYATPGVVL
jgi:hypothetical protein